MQEITFEDWLFEKYADDANADINLVPEPAKTVMSIYLAHYLIGNGGYRYFFENNLSGNTTYKMILESCKRVGLSHLAESFEKVLNLFPDSQPHEDLTEREKFLSKYFEVEDKDGNPVSTYSPVVEEAERLYFNEYKNIPEAIRLYFEENYSEYDD